MCHPAVTPQAEWSSSPGAELKIGSSRGRRLQQTGSLFLQIFQDQQRAPALRRPPDWCEALGRL